MNCIKRVKIYGGNKMNVITPKEVEQLMDNKKELSIIDVRENEEVAEGAIPGMKHIPLGQLAERKEELDKTKEHILVCRSGKRSASAYSQLESEGYNVKNMTGGMNEWGGRVE